MLTQHAPQVAVGVHIGVEAAPHPVQLGQAGLYQVLGGVPVAGEQHRGPQVMRTTPPHEGDERSVEHLGVASLGSVPFG